MRVFSTSVSGNAVAPESDAAGQVRMPVSVTGSWYARTMHMRRIAEPPFEWESFWASVTFPVR